jgi:UDP-N-acetylglucosamine 2-epimerase
MIVVESRAAKGRGTVSARQHIDTAPFDKGAIGPDTFRHQNAALDARKDACIQQHIATLIANAHHRAIAQTQISRILGMDENLRSPFPEEMNRRLTSPLARWNFCPTEQSRANLLREGMAPSSCYVTGNTVIDALLTTKARLAAAQPDIVSLSARLGITDAFAAAYLTRPTARWILVTGHRRESFGPGFEGICQGLRQIVDEHPEVGIVYPVHLNPLVQEPVRRLLGGHPRIALASPAAYEDFVWLMDRASFVLTDSGGIQEEAPALGKPVLVMRENTERPEGIAAGTCELVGTDPRRIATAAARLLVDQAEYLRRSQLRNPYGDGTASQQIREVLERELR